MNQKNTENFSQEMLEASLLQPDDERRRQLETKISSLGEQALEQYRQLLAQNEQLSRELADIQVPVALQDRLLAISAGQTRVSYYKKNSTRWIAALAATVVLAAGFALSNHFMTPGAVDIPGARKVAGLAIDNHLHNPEVNIITLDPDYLESHLAGSIPFDIVMPAVSSAYRLVGGRSLQMDAHPAVYTKWADTSSQYSVFQFRCADFGMPDHIAKKVVHCSEVGCPEAQSRKCDVVVWSEDGRGYALVADNSRAMEYLSLVSAP